MAFLNTVMILKIVVSNSLQISQMSKCSELDQITGQYLFIKHFKRVLRARILILFANFVKIDTVVGTKHVMCLCQIDFQLYQPRFFHLLAN